MPGRHWSTGLLFAAGLSISLLAPTTGSAGTATPWPEFQSTLAPRDSTSPNTAALPSDIKIAPPGAGVPADLAKFSGTWTGWMGLNGQGPEGSTKLAVESLSPAGGTVVYAYANARIPNFQTRIPALFENGELHASIPKWNAIVAWRMRPDGNLDVFWKNDREWYSGVLSKTP